MDATTIRASTVASSIPTSDTRTHASMTIPLSSTRSRTSISELPLGERSTAISLLLLSCCRGGGGRLDRWARVCAQTWIGAPPIESNLLGFVDRADEETNLNREKFDVGKIDLDVTDDDETLVEHAVEDVNEAVSARRG